MREQAFIIFVVCRLLGVVLRPLTLLLALQLPDGNFAQNYALLLTAVVSSYVIFGNQNHRKAYSYFLDKNSKRQGLGGTRIILHYLDGVAVHIILFTPFAALSVWLWTENLMIWAWVMPLLLIEKFYDDHQRALIYKAQYLEWSLHLLFRTIIPSGVILFFVFVFKTASISSFASISIFCFVVYMCLVSPHFLRVLKLWFGRVWPSGFQGIRTRAVEYFSQYRKEFMGAQILTILAINILVVDRFYVKSFFSDHFAQYVFTVNVMAVIPLMHNMFYFTRIRPKLIDRTYPVLSTFMGVRNIAPPVVLAVFALMSFPIMVHFKFIEGSLSVVTVIGIALVYVLSAISLILQEFVFWRTRREILVTVDITLFLMLFLIMAYSPARLEVIPYALSFILFLRIPALTYLSTTDHPRLRLPFLNGENPK